MVSKSDINETASMSRPSSFGGKRPTLSRKKRELEQSLDRCLDRVFLPPKNAISEFFISLRREDPKEISDIIRPDHLSEEEIKIEVRGLSKIFNSNQPGRILSLLEKGVGKEEILERTGATVGLYDINFNVKKGELFVLMGLSGSGKSTLERCINRLIEPTSGEVLIDGMDVLKLRSESLRMLRKHKMSMVFQSFALLPQRTVLENVSLGLEIRGMGREERFRSAMEAIELVGLKGYENMRPSELSGGMKQRVGLARALATDADILLMDEAFSALDPLIRKDMQNELLDLQARMQKTIIFVTHDLEEALKLGDRIALMNNGRIVQIGTAEDILTNPADDFVSRFVEGVDRDKVLTCQNIMMKAEHKVTIGQGLRTALMIMKDANVSTVPVVDKNQTFQGLLDADDALKGIRDGKTKIMEVARTDIESVRPDTSLDALISILIVTNYPIPVVGDDDRLKGIIVPANVIPFLNSQRRNGE